MQHLSHISKLVKLKQGIDKLPFPMDTLKLLLIVFILLFLRLPDVRIIPGIVSTKAISFEPSKVHDAIPKDDNCKIAHSEDSPNSDPSICRNRFPN